MARSRAQQTRRQFIIVLLAAVLLVGGGLFYFINQPQSRGSGGQPEGRVAVPVAAANLPRGTMLTMTRVRLDYMPPEFVPADAVINLDEFNRRILTRDKRAGDYIRQDDLGGVNAPSSYSGLIPAGKRVVVLDTERIEGTMGYLRIGDKVDVVSVTSPVLGRGNVMMRGMNSQGTFGFATSNSGQPGQLSSRQRQAVRNNMGAGQVFSTGEISGTILAAGAEVLDPPRMSRNNQFHNVVLATDKQDAEQVLLAQAAGHQLKILFRPYDEEEGPEDRSIQLRADPRIIEVISGSNRSLMQAGRDY